jgi:hypothetical protein
MLQFAVILLEDPSDSRLIKDQSLEPRGMLTRPEGALRIDVPVTDQQTVEPLAGPLEVHLGAFAATRQLPIRLLGRLGWMDLRQLSGGEQSQQLASVSPVGLDPIPRLDRHQRWRDDLADAADLLEQPLQHKATDSRLIADLNLAGSLLTDLLEHPLDLSGGVGHREFLDLSSVRMNPGDLMLLFVGIHRDMCYRSVHDRFSESTVVDMWLCYR